VVPWPPFGALGCAVVCLGSESNSWHRAGEERTLVHGTATNLRCFRACYVQWLALRLG